MLFSISCFDAPDGTAKRDEFFPSHKAFLATAEEWGVRIEVAGPYTEDDGETLKGSLIIVEAESREVVEKFNAADPYTINGIWGKIEITGFIRRR